MNTTNNPINKYYQSITNEQMKKPLNYFLLICLFVVLDYLLICLFSPMAIAASLPSSTNYKLQNYTFGAGGVKDASSTNFKLNGIAGEVEFGRPSSTNFKAGSGLTFLMKSNVPGAPTFTNPSSNYDRLQFIINTSNNPTDTTYALQISTDSSFATNINYVKSDNTIGSTLILTDFKSYTAWGGGSGNYVTGLVQGTTYYLRVKARQGNYTESEYGPSASATTSNASLTFSVNSSTLTFNNLNAGNSFTDSSKSTILTTSTNAYNGYVVNARESAVLTAAGFGTIANYAGTNSAPTTWSGTGFGYTTDDSNLTGGTADRFTNGGPKYAGFTTSSPGDPVADHPGPILTAISSEVFNIGYRVTVSNTQPAAKYTNTVLYIVVPSY